MTRTERCDQQVFRIVQPWIAPQQRIVRAFYDRLSRATQLPTPIITVVSCVPVAPIAGPSYLLCIVMQGDIDPNFLFLFIFIIHLTPLHMRICLRAPRLNASAEPLPEIDPHPHSGGAKARPSRRLDPPVPKSQAAPRLFQPQDCPHNASTHHANVENRSQKL